LTYPEISQSRTEHSPASGSYWNKSFHKAAMDETDQTLSKPSRFWSACRLLMRLGMWALLLAWLFSFFGQQFFVAELLSNFRFQFFGLFAISLLLTWPARAKWLLFTCLFFAVVWSGWETTQLFLPAKQPTAGTTKVRLMSFNALATNVEFDLTVAEIREHDPDIVAIIEYASMWHVALDALNKSHPHQHRDPRWHGYGIAIFSKLPLESAKSIPLTKDAIDNPAAYVSFNVDGQQVRLMAVHVMSPINRYRLELRNRQFEEIADQIKADSSPAILVGDMNCTPSSRYLANLINEANLRDSRKGFGIQPTWPTFAAPMAVPIDHVLVSDTIHIHNRFVGDAGESDHWPVIVDFSIGSN